MPESVNKSSAEYPPSTGNGTEPLDLESMASVCLGLTLRAGRRVLKAFNSGNTAATLKADGSPVTEADIEANHLICSGLEKAFPGIGIVSEELQESHQAKELQYFLVDPIDGTRQFVGGQPEFTINIAFVDNRKPAFGVIYAPALGRLFQGWGKNGVLVSRVDGCGRIIATQRARGVGGQSSRNLRLVASRSHRDHEGMRDLINHYGVTDFTTCSSSLKFGLLAAGEADIYPRFSGISEWDIAAGHAILRAGGGEVLCMDSMRPLRYGHRACEVPPFVALAAKVPWKR